MTDMRVKRASNFFPSCHLLSSQGTYEEREFQLFVTHKKKKKEEEEEEMEKETLTQFYRVEDIFDFDNVGVSKVQYFSDTVDCII